MNLSANEIHLWIINDLLVDDSQLSEYKHLLVPEELARYQRFYFDRDKRQFLVTRATLRYALSEYLPDVTPGEWTFSRNDYGRPYISGPKHAGAIQFNLSHTDGMIVLAMSQSGDLGVDVENLSRSCEPAQLANRFFSVSESAALLTMSEPHQRDRFFDLWTLKESYIKACGMGLAIPLGSFSFGLVSNNPSIEFESEREDDCSSWRFWQFRGDTTHRIALAYYEAGGITPKVRVGRYLPAGIMKFEEQAAFRATLNP
jgi:4'-phosphopantetheinyl transferase